MFPGPLPCFPQGIMHILKKFAPRPGKKGAARAAPPNSLRIMHILEKHSIFFHFLSFFHFLFFLSFSVIFFHRFFLFFSSCSSFFLGCSFFLPRFRHDFLLKLLCKESIFWAVSGGVPNWSLFFSCLFFMFFHFRFLFQFLSMFFLFFLCFSFFHYLFLYFPFAFLF